MKNDVVRWSAIDSKAAKCHKSKRQQKYNSKICETFYEQQHDTADTSTHCLNLATSGSDNNCNGSYNLRNFQCDISRNYNNNSNAPPNIYNNNNNNNTNNSSNTDVYVVQTITTKSQSSKRHFKSHPPHHHHHHRYPHKPLFYPSLRHLIKTVGRLRLCSGHTSYLMLLLQFSVVMLMCSLNIDFVTSAKILRLQPEQNSSSINSSTTEWWQPVAVDKVLAADYFDLYDYIRTSDSESNRLTERDGNHYTHTWAVHIPDGDINDKANTVARDHGFVNFGKIFGDHYHFAHSKVSKRSLTPASSHQNRLDEDDRVQWAAQQVAKSRRKRDFIRMRPSRTSSTSSLVDSVPLSDPKWGHMWYLNRGGGLDMNVIPAWKEGITGKGTVVTILDDGLESDHPDIINNYDPRASYDVNSHDEDPMPHYDLTDSNRHGTRCAGEVAATANNSICAVGIAFGARVGGVRMLDGDVTDAVEARSLSLNPQHIDIYSASWGPDDDGKTVDGPGELASRAFIEGVTKGRAGKGSIFIWASGNGGRELDNCNCDGYTNSIWTLSISSATEEGHVPWYSEKCSSTLATTYSSGGQAEKQVVTTDLHHSCTVSHTGTSASAPLAAGIAALVLESNQNLTWRDLQHIVVRTAKPANLKDPTWSKNGVGRRVSHSFGYGLMDAAGMVKVARSWKTVPEQQRCEINAPHVDKVIPPKSHITLQQTVKYCSIHYLEHVQAKITLTSQRRGDILLNLISPAGTKVTLLTPRIHDVSRSGFNQWPFMSVHTWGESPHGNWQLEIHNEGRYMGHALLREWSLIFYGTAQPIDPNDPISIPRSYIAEITTPNTSSGSTTNLYQVYSAQYPRISPNNFGSTLLGMTGKIALKLPPNKSAYITNADVSSFNNNPLYGNLAQSINGGNNKKAQAKQQQNYQQISTSYGVILAAQNPKNNNNKSNKNNKGKSGDSGGGGGGGGGNGKSNKNNNNSNNNGGGKLSKQKDTSSTPSTSTGGSNKNKFYRISQQNNKNYASKLQQQKTDGLVNQKFVKLQQSAERFQNFEDKMNRKVIGDLPLNNGGNNKSIKSSTSHSQLSVYGKLPIKAPKQVKENVAINPTAATTFNPASTAPLKGNERITSGIIQTNQRITKLFERYEKIQSIFPELQPYQGPKDRESNINSNNKKTSKQVDSVDSRSSSISGSVSSFFKPFRENAKKSSPSFVPDQKIIKKQQLLLAAAGVDDENTNSIATTTRTSIGYSLTQRKTASNAQITQWDLIFYGTESPAQPDDPQPINSGRYSPYGNGMEHNDIEYDSSGQWHNMQQIGESSMMSHDRTNTSCLKATINRQCIACAPPTYFYKGHCYDKCPSHTYIITENDAVDAVSKTNNNRSITPTTNQIRKDDDDILQSLDRKRRNADNKDNTLVATTQLSCGNCDATCRHCSGPLNSQCTACFAGSQMHRTTYTNESFCYTIAERSSGNSHDSSNASVQNSPLSISIFLLALLLIPCSITLSVVFYMTYYGGSCCKSIWHKHSGHSEGAVKYDRITLISDEDVSDEEEEDCINISTNHGEHNT